MKFSGYRNVASLNSYNKPCLEQQRKISEALSSTYSAGTVAEIQPSSSSVAKTVPPKGGSSILDGVFAGAHLSDCTLNINVCIRDEHASTNTCLNTVNCQQQRKRPYVIY